MSKILNEWMNTRLRKHDHDNIKICAINATLLINGDVLQDFKSCISYYTLYYTIGKFEPVYLIKNVSIVYKGQQNLTATSVS